MLPLLDIEKTAQKSVLKAKNSHNIGESGDTEFAEIFNTLTLDSNPKKSKQNTQNTKTIQTSTAPKQNTLAAKQPESSFLKSLDAKYNLFENFKKDSKPTPSSAKDLLDFYTTNQQKTLKDLKEVAENLKLNVQKISVESSPKDTKDTPQIINNTKINATIQKDSTPKTLDNLLANRNATMPNLEPKNLTLKNTPLQTKMTQDSTRPNSTKDKADSILNALLKDKELLVKDSNPSLAKKEVKENKQAIPTSTKANSKIDAKPDVTMDLKTDLKTDTKLDTKANAESQNAKLKPTQTEPNNIASTKEQDSKTLKDSKDSKNKIESKIAESKPKETLKEGEVTQKESAQKDNIQTKEKDSTILKEAIKTAKETQTTQTIQAEVSKNQAKENITAIPKETTKTTKETPTAQIFKAEISKNQTKDSKEMPKGITKEAGKETSKTTPKEFPKDSKSTQNLTQEWQNERILDFKSEQMHFDLKQDQAKQSQSAQENFLDNFLKPSQKAPKEILKEAQHTKEKESQKLNQEIYQNAFQNQRDMRFNIQNTFTHFSDRLRDAIANYRPPVTKISLELNPENLGSVELTIAKNGDKLSVQISSNQTALQLIMQNAQDFKNSLNNLGFQDVELDFKDNQGNSLENGNFSGGNENSGNNGGGFQQHNQNQQEMQNFTQNAGQNTENTETWNENSLHIYKEVNNPYVKVALVEINFSYYA